MQMPVVKEISALSAHRREVALVRLSLLAVPEREGPPGTSDPGDPLRRMAPPSTPATPARHRDDW
jgi:hypothetical protein